MKKILLIIGLGLLLLSMLASFAVPAFAHDPSDGDTTGATELWPGMPADCASGDYAAMSPGAAAMHEELGDPPCHEFDASGSEVSGGDAPHWQEHMDGAMMGHGGPGTMNW